ncbi:trypsin beta-like [Daphnia carinata]|uniref:trypsin beta-like n=1 Tax=Daphnia carinata TaxID=120202 RepID=UPI00258003F5|nr:trypsin beta-like [Daphnia carinata]
MRFTTSSLSLFFFILGASASPLITGDVVTDEERILGGTKATEGEFPYIVSITTNGEHICGGFIYNQRFIVTTASCVLNLVPFDVTIVVGQVSLIFNDQYERRYQVVSIIPHENYDPVLGVNNLAVIETSSSIAFTPGHVEYIYYNEDNMTVGATIMGWGTTQEEGLPSVDLLKANVTISTDCVVYGSEEYQPNYMICAGSPTASPCHYDDGSPLVQGNIVVGVAARNTGCGANFLPTLYTRLSSYYAWLNRNAGLQPPMSG